MHTLRCKLRRDYPALGIALQRGLQADEDVNGWSLPIRTIATGREFDASQIDWSSGLRLRATTHNYELYLPGHRVKIFTSGISEGLRDLVECYVIPRGQQFYLSYPDHTWPLLEHWAMNHCIGFREIEVHQGLPNSWRLSSIDEALDDDGVRRSFPMLSFPEKARLRLVGGIRSGFGNNFFSFAPPLVALSGMESECQIHCGDSELSPTADGSTYSLPGDINVDSKITIEARSGTTVLRRSLFLTGDFSLPQVNPEFFLDANGNFAGRNDNEPMVAGAYIENPPPWHPSYTAELFRDLEHEVGRIRGFLIGEHPGQIIK